MNIELSNEAKMNLERQHKLVRDGRIKDRIKAVLLHCEGWQKSQIAQALRIRPQIVHDHLEVYKTSKK